MAAHQQATSESDLHLVDAVNEVDPSLAFEDVPSAGPDAVVDPNWLQLRSGALLPMSYMPPAMPGVHRPFFRVIAVVLVCVFVSATAAGVCLTYGAPHWAH